MINRRTAARLALASSLLVVTCCQTPAPAPPAPPPAVQTPPPPPPQVTLPPASDWIDRPQTPGTWSYGRDGARTLASFGQGARAATSFRMACTAQGRVALIAPGAQGTQMRVLTETVERVLTGTQSGGALVIELPANDPLLDAMAITRGRFGIEATGGQGLYLPAWAEVTRVIEDCR